MVNFANVGTVTIYRRVWYKHHDTGKVVASRTQYPLTLSYAITAHRVAGLNIGQNCGSLFNRIYTGTDICGDFKGPTRTKPCVLRSRFLMPPPPSLAELILRILGEPDSSFCCCRRLEQAEKWDFVEKCEGDNLEISEIGVSIEYKSLTKQYFETNKGVFINLEDVLLCLSDFSHQLSHSPSDFDVKRLLTLKNNNVSSLSKSIRLAAVIALNNIESFQLLLQIFWCRIFILFQNHLTENLGEIHMTNKNFTSATSKVHELFMSTML